MRRLVCAVLLSGLVVVPSIQLHAQKDKKKTDAPAPVDSAKLSGEFVGTVKTTPGTDRLFIVSVEVKKLVPTNKNPGSNREQYLGKRRQLLNSWVNLVEIDLLRGGPRMPAEELPPCAYCLLVSRFMERPNAGLWPLQLRDLVEHGVHQKRKAAVAVAVVGVAAALLNVTAATMRSTVYWIEVVSYLLIIGIGLRLLWVKGRAAISALRDLRRGGEAQDSSGRPCSGVEASA